LDVDQIDLRPGLTFWTQIRIIGRRFFSSAPPFSHGKDGNGRRRGRRHYDLSLKLDLRPRLRPSVRVGLSLKNGKLKLKRPKEIELSE
jgi:hypothetical protein